MTTKRKDPINVEQAMRVMQNALRHIARSRDCDYHDEASRPNPCDCPPCEARAAIEATKDWRYMGRGHDRATDGHHPRETKMLKAWRELVDDRHLSMIVDNNEHGIPSPRDWYVATSVVQWLATNVGVSVLEGAGFKYQQWEHDRALFEQRMKEEQSR